MTTTSATGSADTTSSLLSLIGSTSGSTSGANASSAALNEQDFLTLMTTQLQDQDPLNPTSNAEFFSQIAQFATVSGIGQLNTSFSSLASQLTSAQGAQAASMIGQSVLYTGSTGTLATGGSVTGAVEAAGSGDVVVQVRNSAGVLVNTLDLGQQLAGRVGFNWNGTDSTGAAAPAGSYSFSAQVVNGTSSVAATTDMAAQVASVSFGSSGLTLNLANGGSVPFTSVLQLY